MFKYKQKGISIIEVIVATAILAVILVGIFQLLSYSHLAVRKNEYTARATSLASEAIEAARFVRDDNWDTFASFTIGSSYHPVEGSGWTLQAGCENINNFQRCIEFESVSRDDVTGDPVESGGIQDSDTRKITVEVTWTDGGKNNVYSIETYLTNWH